MFKKFTVLILAIMITLSFIYSNATPSIPDPSMIPVGVVNPPSPSSVAVVVYSDVNYNGASLNLSVGKFNKQSLFSKTFKQIKSIKFLSDDPIILFGFESDTYTGQSFNTNASFPNLTNVFSKKIHSLFIVANKGFVPTPTPSTIPTPTPSGGGGCVPTPTPTNHPTPTLTVTITPTPTTPPILPPTGEGGMADQNKNLYNALLALFLLVATLVLMSTMGNGNNNSNTYKDDNEDYINHYEESIESKHHEDN